MGLFDSVPADKSLDDLVAEHVMGWRRGIMDPTTWYEHAQGWYGGHRKADQWWPSVFIGDAWEVIERMLALGMQHPLVRFDSSRAAQPWTCAFTRPGGAHGYRCDEETAPLAICRAALMAAGDDAARAAAAPQVTPTDRRNS